MKPLVLLLSIILIAACSSRPVVQTSAASVPGNTLPSEGIESVRYAETIKAYPLGRYIDPKNRLLMHEGHTLYRVETTGKWNLHPNEPVAVPLGPLRTRSAARVAPPVNEELIAEINRQKQLTRTLIQGGDAVSTQLEKLAAGVKQAQQAVAENSETRAAVENTKNRLDAIEELLRQQRAESPSGIPDKAEDPEW